MARKIMIRNIMLYATALISDATKLLITLQRANLKHLRRRSKHRLHTPVAAE